MRAPDREPAPRPQAALPTRSRAARLSSTSPSDLHRATAFYAGASALTAVLAALGGQPAWQMVSWWGLGPREGAAVSLAAGGGLAAVTLVATRVALRRSPRARALHAALRPVVRGASDRAIVALGASSALGEELFFRGVLTSWLATWGGPWLGVVVPAAAFGLLHQVAGEGRWLWAAWAAAMGLSFGLVFGATGSLAGPILAHAAVNIVNLRLLRDHDPSAAPESNAP
jgi:membrane protease YdiL (CAAX protease family)